MTNQLPLCDQCASLCLFPPPSVSYYPTGAIFCFKGVVPCGKLSDLKITKENEPFLSVWPKLQSDLLATCNACHGPPHILLLEGIFSPRPPNDSFIYQKEVLHLRNWHFKRRFCWFLVYALKHLNAKGDWGLLFSVLPVECVWCGFSILDSRNCFRIVCSHLAQSAAFQVTEFRAIEIPQMGREHQKIRRGLCKCFGRMRKVLRGYCLGLNCFVWVILNGKWSCLWVFSAFQFRSFEVFIKNMILLK